MLLFFKKLRRTLLSENRFNKYLLYAFGEIVLVVIGILIALQINNWNTNRLKRQEEKKSYQDIRQQITDDMNEIIRVKNFNNYFSDHFTRASQIISSNNRAKMDSLTLMAMMLSQTSDFFRSGNIYETLVNSGDLKLLKNTDITSRLQKLEMTYTHINRLEEIHWEIVMSEFSPEIKGVINYATQKAVKPEKLYSVEIQNIFIECIFLTKGKEAIYDQAINEIEEIVNLIDEELGS
jgi:hypothetical protein